MNGASIILLLLHGFNFGVTVPHCFILSVIILTLPCEILIVKQCCVIQKKNNKTEEHRTM